MILSSEEIEKRVADSYELPNEVLKEIPEPMVSIRTSTYNHGPYIKQCIEGVLMQKTSFPFEYIIGEDFSTDETREIVFEYAKKYPQIIRVVTADYNVGSKANGQRCIRRSRGKYMAICEGDDYWTDPLKLQKQVDFLEANDEYGLVYSKVRVFVQKNQKMALSLFGSQISSYEQLLLVNTIPTLTACFRTIYLLEYIKIEEMHNKLLGDYPLWLYIASKSKLKFIDEVVGVYRKLESSASHSKSYSKQLSFIQSGVDIQLWFAQNSNLKDNVREKILLKYYVDAFYLLLLTHNYKEAYRALAFSCKSLNIIFSPFMLIQLLGCKSSLIICGIERIKRFILNRIRYY